MRHLSPILLLLLPSCIPATSVVFPAVQGRVLTPAGNPVPHATLHFTDALNPREVATLQTDAAGRFSSPPISRFGFFLPGTDFYHSSYLVSLSPAPRSTTPPPHSFLGPSVHVFAFSPPRTPTDLGDLTFLSPTQPLHVPSPASRRTAEAGP